MPPTKRILVAAAALAATAATAGHDGRLHRRAVLRDHRGRRRRRPLRDERRRRDPRLEERDRPGDDELAECDLAPEGRRLDYARWGVGLYQVTRSSAPAAGFGPLRLHAGRGTFAGVVAGVLLAAGVLTLLQQYSVVYPPVQRAVMPPSMTKALPVMNADSSEAR